MDAVASLAARIYRVPEIHELICFAY